MMVFNGLEEKYDRLCGLLEEQNKLLREFPRSDQQPSPQLREWERFALIDGGNATAGGALTVGGGGANLKPSPTGWEAYVHSVALTVSGASAAATVAYYNGEVNEQNLFDYQNAMSGNSPSRLVTFYATDAVYVEQGDPINIVFTATAASASVYVRVTGRRRMLGVGK